MIYGADETTAFDMNLLSQAQELDALVILFQFSVACCALTGWDFSSR